MPPKKQTAAKKKRSTGSKNDMKTKPTSKSVTAFINAVENETRKRDAKTLLAMMKRITGEKPTMWGPSIIGFGKYHYVYESGREGDMPIIGFSPRKASMSLYVLGSVGDDRLFEKLGKHKRSVACLYVNKLEDIDLAILEKIIVKSFKATTKKCGA